MEGQDSQRKHMPPRPRIIRRASEHRLEREGGISGSAEALAPSRCWGIATPHARSSEVTSDALVRTLHLAISAHGEGYGREQGGEIPQRSGNGDDQGRTSRQKDARHVQWSEADETAVKAKDLLLGCPGHGAVRDPEAEKTKRNGGFSLVSPTSNA